MKSKHQLIERLIDILVLLLNASKDWLEIRDEISALLEYKLDDLDPELADRLLGFFEILDNLSKYFSEVALKEH